MTQLSADDLFDLRFVRGGRLSPRGDAVAFSVARVEAEVERVEVFMGPIDGPQTIISLAGSIRVESPVWSPSGEQLVVVADGRARIIDVGSGAVTDPVTPAHAEVAGEPSWSPDGTRIAVSLIEQREMSEPRILTEFAYRADGRGFIDGLDQGIFEVRLVDGAIRRLVPEEFGLSMRPRWSPSGRDVMFFATHDAVPFASYSPSLSVVDAETGVVRELLTPDHWFVADAHWTPGGDRIVVVGARDSTLPIPYTGIWLMDEDGQNLSLRTPGIDAKPGMHIHHDMSAWDLTANVLTVPIEDAAFVTFQARGDVEVWRVGLRGAPEIDRVLTGSRSCIILDASADAGRLLYAVSEFRSPTELWTANLDGSAEKRFTSLNDDVLDTWPAFTVEPYSVVSPDGRHLDAWFLALDDRRGPLPTVLYIHGGPYGATGAAFRFDLLLLAAQGFGVAFSNFRGSAGYGESHARAIVGGWGENGLPDHLATIDRAIELGYSDGDRLGVWGASHGGFASLWMVTHSDRFRAAIAEAGVASFVTMYYLSDAPASITQEMGGTPNEVPDLYRARSPLTYVGRCTTPTMLVHGENDLRCPITEAEQIYRGLLDAGCPVELVRLAGADHLGDSSGPIPARRAQNEALMRWFGTHL